MTCTNPVYMANAYRLKSNLTDVQAQMTKALGPSRACVSKQGQNASKLRDYHHKMMMPYFTDQDLLADHGSYRQAVNAVNAGLAAHKGGTSKVYQVNIPG